MLKFLKALFVAVGVIVLVLTFLVGAIFLMFAWPTNDRANASRGAHQEMIPIACEWGRLAPFPATAQDFTIYTEGNMFTRTFKGAFSDSPEVIAKWLADSPGVVEGEAEVREDQSTLYILKMGGGASYGEIEVSPDKTRVRFRTSWS